MATFIKARLKKSNDQMNIVKYRVAANITEYHIISKLIFFRMFIPKFVLIRLTVLYESTDERNDPNYRYLKKKYNRIF